MPDPAHPSGTWLLYRVAEAVDGHEVSATLLTDLHAAIAEVRARPPEARDTLALMELADRVNLPVDELSELLTTLEAQPTEARERFLRGFVEACWSNNGRRTTRSSTEVAVAKGLEGRQEVLLEEVVLA